MRIKIIIMYTLAILLLPTSVKTNAEMGSLSDPISYYWFDTSGNYLRQNTRAAEEWATGYDSNTTEPKTLREKGYAPANCNPGSPPSPVDPDFPDVLFYSHP
jgi:hypothetical protein